MNTTTRTLCTICTRIKSIRCGGAAASWRGLLALPTPLLALTTLALLLAGAATAEALEAQGGEAHGAHAGAAAAASGAPSSDTEHSKAVEQDAAGAMSHHHMEMGAHMTMSRRRTPAPGDQEKAAAIVKTLRTAVEKYRDYQVAVGDGYVQYLPNLPQPMYHFTNWGNGYQAAFSFDPARPTSLLYKKTRGGFELIGAMYTAPKEMPEEKLDARVPLSVASWHQHTNVCLPPKERYLSADWKKFGFAGTISTAADCAAAGGEFHPVIFGWMVHVYPFETEPEKIWAH